MYYKETHDMTHLCSCNIFIIIIIILLHIHTFYLLLYFHAIENNRLQITFQVQPTQTIIFPTTLRFSNFFIYNLTEVSRNEYATQGAIFNFWLIGNGIVFDLRGRITDVAF